MTWARSDVVSWFMVCLGINQSDGGKRNWIGKIGAVSLVFISLAFTGFCYPESDAPTPSPREEAKPPENKTQNDKQPPTFLNDSITTNVTGTRIQNAPSVHISSDDQQAGAQKKAPDHWWVIPEWWSAIAGGLTLILLGFQVRYFWVQLRLMRETIGEMKVSDERHLRPFLMFSIEKFPEIIPNALLNFNFVCTNHGPTPAVDVAFRCVLNFVKNPITDSESIWKMAEGIEWNGNRMNVPSNSTANEASKARLRCATRHKLTQEQVDSVIKDTHSLVIWVEFRYKDIFQRKEPFCTKETYIVINDPGDIKFMTIPGSSRMT